MFQAQTHRACSVLVVALALVSAARGQTFELISRGMGGAPADGPSGPSGLTADVIATSADGRFVAFTSSATNLTPVDTNGSVRDVFLVDRVLQSTELVSVWGAGLQGVTDASGAAISDDGRFVAFVSGSLMPADPDPFAPDLFVRDRLNGTTVELTPTETNPSDQFAFGPPQMSADGRYVGIHYRRQDMFYAWTYLNIWDRTTGALAWSRSSFEDLYGSGTTGEYVWGLQLSRSGLWAVYTRLATSFMGAEYSLLRSAVATLPTSDSTLLYFHPQEGGAFGGTFAQSTTGRYLVNVLRPVGSGVQMQVLDVVTGLSERVDVTQYGWPLGVAFGHHIAGVSDDGRHVAFVSASSQFVPGDTNGVADLFVRDRLTQSTWRASLDAAGAQADGATHSFALQPDGTAVVLASSATNLIAGDTNGFADVFRRELWGLDGGAYCTATTSANGCTGEISAIGSPSAGQPAGYTVRIDGADGRRSGLIFYGASAASIPFAPAHPSTHCIGAPRQRTEVASSGGTSGSCDGAFALDVLAWAAQHPAALLTPLAPGQSMCFQGWVREPTFAPATLLTNAWWVTLSP